MKRCLAMSSVQQFSLLFWAVMVSAIIPTGSLVAEDKLGAPVAISGKLEIVDSSRPLNALTLSVNGDQISVSRDGSYSSSISEADVYELQIDGPSIFASVHTFAHVELEQTKRDKLVVPDIELVEKRPGRVEMVFGGDVMMGRRYLKPRWNEPVLIRPDTRAADMKKLVAPMIPYFRSADYAALNLESILAETEPTNHAPKSVVFWTHPDIIEALESLGIDYVSLGNNHTYDYLDDGLHTTLEALAESKLSYSGAGFNEAEALAPHRTLIGGQDYSMLGYVGWKGRVTPSQVAEPNKGGAAMGSKDNILASVSKETADKRITVIQYHGSREYSEGPTQITEVRLKAAIDAGADLVIGHHPHVAQGLELYKGKLIAWSIGNFIFDQFFYETHGAIALKVWMDGETFYRAEVIPLHIKAYRPIPAMAGVRRHVLERVMALSAKHGTNMSFSGGHAVVTASNSPAASTNRSTHKRLANGSIVRTAFPLTELVLESDHDYHNHTAMGSDLFFRGDFENYSLLGLQERSWDARNATLRAVRTPRSGRFALQLKAETPDLPVQLGLKTFLRVLNQDSYSVSFWIKVPETTRVKAYIQSRPKGMNRYKALAEAELLPIGIKSISAGAWTHVNFNFDVGRTEDGKPLPTRPILRFGSVQQTGGKAAILIDDFAVIGWE